MAVSDKFKEGMNSLTDWLNEQSWFQELRSKYDELDAQSKLYLNGAAAVGTCVLVVYLLGSSIYGVYKLRHEIVEKSNLLSMIQSANDEVHRLRDSSGGGTFGASSEGGPWQAYFENVFNGAQVDKVAYSISGEKSGNSTELSKETLYELSMKHVNIKQIVRVANALESGSRPVKLRNLTIDTKNDPNGFLDASLSVSAFKLTNP